ncbi:alpha-D-xyloside xylohydrolase [Rhodoferax saidenbachensis]|uniref:Alpha-D-xyloside xylohydrolase n=2 Tax=Rhodoferax saidenbachensis TaxID=1484693 RepID=A0ABU1ZV38_9BURK|nr:TIM-barrel domain-containing protein [Rhodoferax saidenbachensis]MDR7308401.1 alpha-D-xyloside xylohydrolase [Rhodoferax saidenbachensis]
MLDEDWALLPADKSEVKITLYGDSAAIVNGNIRADVSAAGKITFSNQNGDLLLQEYLRSRKNISEFCSALNIDAREFKPVLGGDYGLTARFESNPEEKVFGMGLYQQPFLDIKNCTLELAHRNSQATIPFFLSNLGYGFLWNNPAIGQVTFGKNITEWNAKATKQLDYWITAGDTPAAIEQAYAAVTGTAPMMPDYGMGFWQCKLRYQTQEELLEVAREYKRHELPISVIVVDFFHWTNQGDWRFDPDYWPDPEGMVRELRSMGIELMVSIWPTVDKTSENYEEMLRKGYLIRTDRGIRTSMDFLGNTVFFDATNPKARQYVWEKAKTNYYDKGVRIFWLDEAEPEYSVYDFDNYRYHLGPNVQVGNIYPLMYAKTFYEGMEQEGQKDIINLIRCAWAGSQKYGALVWSGDIDSSFASLRNQLAAGLSMGLSGIPWFTTDIGGFHGGNPDDPDFRECMVRWFQFGAFCPVFRMHGDREPHSPPLGMKGGGLCASGAPNEVWSYGDEAFDIFKKYMLMRERLRPYITRLMKEAHDIGTPPMRPLFYDFPKDQSAWGVEDQYMFGPDLLIAPVLHERERVRRIYLPDGANWKECSLKVVHEGGQWITVNAPLSEIPIFIRDGANLPI